jgi:hypothetical protein
MLSGGDNVSTVMRGLDPAASIEPVLDVHAVAIDGADLSVWSDARRPAAME